MESHYHSLFTIHHSPPFGGDKNRREIRPYGRQESNLRFHVLCACIRHQFQKPGPTRNRRDIAL